MKKNFLPSGAFNALMKKAGKSLMAVALLFTAKAGFAHRAEPFVYQPCVTIGSSMTIDANIFSAGAATWYRWQYLDNSGQWKCFVAGNNTINGVVYNITGTPVSTAPAADDAPSFTITNARPSLENVLVRVLMKDNSLPGCTTTNTSGHVLGGTPSIYGGDDAALNETKYLRLHVFASTSICPPNAFACTNNILVSGTAPNQQYYGGFEAISYNATTGVYTRNNFGSNAGTDYAALEVGTTNGTYWDANNPAVKSSTYTRNIAPHSGNYQMIVEGSSTTSPASAIPRVWYKTITVAANSQYRFDIWVAKIDGTNPVIQLAAGANVLTTYTFTSSVTAGDWKLVHGVFTATSTGSVTFAVRETSGSKNFVLDDICLSVCTNCGALPLHQLNLSTTLQGNNVNLKFIAENEMGTEKFVVERSLDNVTYTEIGAKAPSGPVNTPTNYLYNDDVQALVNSNSVVYYRIKALDHEGRFAYSNIATVRFGKTAGVQVWPNPINADHVNISYNSAANTKVDVRLVNSTGGTIKQSNYTVTRGLNQLSLTGLGSLPSGIYFIRVTDTNTNEVYIQKLSK